MLRAWNISTCWRSARERGQSIVLLAFAMIALLLFAGLAIDAGVIYVASVRLSRAVDAAVLAGVVELPNETSLTSTDLADKMALRFLGANEITTTVDISLDELLVSSRRSGEFGTFRYMITATHQVDLYFLPLVNFDSVRLRDYAAAELNPLVNIYVSQTGVYGQQGPVNLAVFGPDSCTCFGDSWSPRWGQGLEDGGCARSVPNPWWGEAKGVYHFRLSIPHDYESRARALTARWNEGQDTNDVVRIEIWDPDCYNNSVQVTGCGGWIDPCTPETGNPESPFRFVRIDENRGPGCTDGGSAAFWTTTRYSLYYYRLVGGIFHRINLASYTVRDDADTDMQWVSPSGFEFQVPEDIYVAPDGSTAVFLDVQTLSGSSENGFDLWAGPRYSDVPPEVNARNEWIVRHPSWLEYSAGATWFGMGRLTMNSNSKESHVPITLAYIPPEWRGREITVSSFDFEPNLTGSVTFFLTSSKCEGYQQCIDGQCNWCVPVKGDSFIDGNWRRITFTLPERGFFGAYLEAWYDAWNPHDTFGWRIVSQARPTLVE